MKIARVIGNVWATRKLPDLKGIKFLILQPIDVETGHDAGDYVVAADSQQAGVGEIVYFVTSKEAAFPFATYDTAIDAAIVGHVDRIDL